MVFGSDDAALRAAAEPHISRMVESNFFRTIFISMFCLRLTSLQDDMLLSHDAV
jgi:hypothetical protein